MMSCCFLSKTENDVLNNDVIKIAHIVCIGVSTPTPSKTPPPLSCQAPPLNRQTVQASPFLGNLPSILIFREPPPLKFLGKISQFEFLVMTEKNIFAYNNSFFY